MWSSITAILINDDNCEGTHKMAAKGNSSRLQKNTVRIVLATAATVVTLIGAQALAFGGRVDAQAQSQQSDTTTSMTVQSSFTNQVTTDAVQPMPRTRASR